MQAIHGGQAQNEKLDSQTIAVWLRGGRLPQASVSPADMRATRDLLRRRLSLTRTRAALLGHVPQTHRQYPLPQSGKKLADKGHRTGVVERCSDPAVPKSVAVARALIGYDDHRLRDLEWPLVPAATQPAPPTLSLLHTSPGIGTILSLVLFSERHDIARFPSGQDGVSSCRLVKCAKEAAGQRSGTSGTKIGHAALTWACSEAAVLLLRDHPAGQKSLARLEKKHGKGKALTLLAPQLARAVSSMLKRGVVCDGATVLRSSRRGVGEPAASRGHPGWSRGPRAQS